MNIYVAGRVKAIDRVQEVQSKLVDVGHEIIFDWTGSEVEIRNDWSFHQNKAREISRLEIAAVKQCDALILVGDGCESGGGGLGCFIETGIAISEDKLIVILHPTRESVFWYSSDKIFRTKNLYSAISWLEHHE